MNGLAWLGWSVVLGHMLVFSCNMEALRDPSIPLPFGIRLFPPLPPGFPVGFPVIAMPFPPKVLVSPLVSWVLVGKLKVELVCGAAPNVGVVVLEPKVKLYGLFSLVGAAVPLWLLPKLKRGFAAVAAGAASAAGTGEAGPLAVLFGNNVDEDDGVVSGFTKKPVEGATVASGLENIFILSDEPVATCVVDELVSAVGAGGLNMLLELCFAGLAENENCGASNTALDLVGGEDVLLSFEWLKNAFMAFSGFSNGGRDEKRSVCALKEIEGTSWGFSFSSAGFTISGRSIKGGVTGLKPVTTCGTFCLGMPKENEGLGSSSILVMSTMSLCFAAGKDEPKLGNFGTTLLLVSDW